MHGSIDLARFSPRASMVAWSGRPGGRASWDMGEDTWWPLRHCAVTWRWRHGHGAEERGATGQWPCCMHACVPRLLDLKATSGTDWCNSLDGPYVHVVTYQYTPPPTTTSWSRTDDDDEAAPASWSSSPSLEPHPPGPGHRPEQIEHLSTHLETGGDGRRHGDPTCMATYYYSAILSCFFFSSSGFLFLDVPWCNKYNVLVYVLH